MKVIVIAGEPASGKSTIVKKLINGSPINFQYGLVKGHAIGSVLFIGTYKPGERYPGTDRLSMAVQPCLQEMLLTRVTIEPFQTIVFEGDRLCNPSLIKWLERHKIETQVFHVLVSEETLQARRVARGDTFDEKWLRGRKTKVSNFVQSCASVETLRNESLEDSERNAALLARLIFSNETR